MYLFKYKDCYYQFLKFFHYVQFDIIKLEKCIYIRVKLNKTHSL